MKAKKFLLSIGILVGFFLVLVVLSEVSASTHTVNYYGWCCSGTTAEARLRALAKNSSQGTCDIRSKTNPSTYVNVIGWTWWQCDTLNSSGVIINTYNFDGDSFSGSSPPSVSNSAATDANYCRYYPVTICGYSVKASGTHDFNHNGAVNWTPYHFTLGP